MQDEPQAYISDRLGGRPTIIDASPACCAPRPRVFWLDFEIRPLKGEVLIKHTSKNELKLVEDPHRFEVWDEGWRAHTQLTGNFPRLVGLEEKSQGPRDPRGLHPASREALASWKRDKWATGIRFYEDVNSAWCSDGKTSRGISETECERMLGFPSSWKNQGQRTPTSRAA